MCLLKTSAKCIGLRMDYSSTKVGQGLTTICFVLLSYSSYIMSFTRALLAESCIRLSNLSGAKYLPSLHFLQPSHYTNINTFCLVLKYARRLLFVTPNNIIYTSSRWLELSKICEVRLIYICQGLTFWSRVIPPILTVPLKC